MTHALSYLDFVCRVLAGGVLAAAAAGKARRLGNFEVTVRQIGLPTAAAGLVGGLIIALEAAVGLGLLAGLWPREIAAVAVGLLGLFVAASAVGGFSERPIPCNCFGVADAPLGRATALRAIMLAVPAVIYYVTSTGDAWAWWPGSLAIAVSVCGLAVASLLGARWILASRELLDLLRQRWAMTSEEADPPLLGVLRG